MRTIGLALVALACTTNKGDDSLGGVTPLDEQEDTATGGDDTGGDSGHDTGDDGSWMKSACEFEVNPTSFTGGLVNIAYLQPLGGEFTVDYTGDTVTQDVGTVDWDAGTISYQSSYIDGYTTVGSTLDGTFTIDASGSYVLEANTTTTFLNGDSWSDSATYTKDGCVTVMESVDDDTAELTTVTSTLVSTDQIDFTHLVTNDEGEGWTYRGEGSRTSDWVSSYTFETDDPDTTIVPDREGSCSHDGTGHAECAGTAWQEDGGYQLSETSWEYNGDWESSWEAYEADATSPSSWGVRSGHYDGSGEATWSTEYADGTVVTCTGSWDTDGAGSWTCDDGSTGSYGG